MQTKLIPTVLPLLAAIIITVSKALAAVVPYGNGSVDVSAVYSSDGAGNILSGHLSAGAAQSVKYASSRSLNVAGDTDISFSGGFVHVCRPASSQPVNYGTGRQATITDGVSPTVFSGGWLSEGWLSSAQTLVTGTSAEYGSYDVHVRQDQVKFENEYLSYGWLNGDQSFPYSFTKSVLMLDDSPVVLNQGGIMSGFLGSNQSLDIGWSSAVSFKKFSYVTFNITVGHFVDYGTNLNGNQSLNYGGGIAATFKDNEPVQIDPNTFYVTLGVLSGTQSLKYHSSRQASILGSSVATFNGFLVSGISGANQTLVTSGGTANVSTFDGLNFAGGFYVP